MMAKRRDHKTMNIYGKSKLLRYWLMVVVLLLIAGCSGMGGESGDFTGASSGGSIRLPPAWTPTPISIPGTGADIGTWQPCDDAPPSQLEVGDLAVVEGTSLKLRLRGEPGIQGTLAGEIDLVDVVEVINGPACADMLVWWEVQSRSGGHSGWTAEGNAYNTWLVRFN